MFYFDRVLFSAAIVAILGTGMLGLYEGLPSVQPAIELDAVALAALPTLDRALIVGQRDPTR